MAKKILPLPAELTRLHYLTEGEADLIFDFRLLSEQAKKMVSSVVKMQSEHYVEPTGGNVIGIARRPAG
jgi:hypothetical protein